MQIYEVGGAVRDRMLGLPVHDHDWVVVGATPQQMLDAGVPHGVHAYGRALYADQISDDAVDTFAARVRAKRSPMSQMLLFRLGEGFSAVGEDDTAFTGRTAAFWASVELFWTDAALDDDARAWARGATATMEPHQIVGRYVNDVVETGADVARTIYGDAKLERLRALKREWDPDNVFRLNQNIRP